MFTKKINLLSPFWGRCFFGFTGFCVRCSVWDDFFGLFDGYFFWNNIFGELIILFSGGDVGTPSSFQHADFRFLIEGLNDFLPVAFPFRFYNLNSFFCGDSQGVLLFWQWVKFAVMPDVGTKTPYPDYKFFVLILAGFSRKLKQVKRFFQGDAVKALFFLSYRGCRAFNAESI